MGYLVRSALGFVNENSRIDRRSHFDEQNTAQPSLDRRWHKTDEPTQSLVSRETRFYCSPNPPEIPD